MADYKHIETHDLLGNQADFFLQEGSPGTGWTPSDRAITLIISNEHIHGKHTFFTSENAFSFLENIGKGYLFEKYGAEQIIDSSAFVKENLEKIINDRKDDSLSSDDARALYNFVKNECTGLKNENELYFLQKENLDCIHELDDYFHIPQKWRDQDINFFENLWKPFVSALKEENVSIEPSSDMKEKITENKIIPK